MPRTITYCIANQNNNENLIDIYKTKKKEYRNLITVTKSEYDEFS